MYFIQLVVQEKAIGDFRAFLYYRVSFKSRQRLELRGYGKTPIEAANDVWNGYEELNNEIT